jgi:phospholipid N-methyltransferase
VPSRGDGLVVELGGGTDVVTDALLQRGVVPGRLVAIERRAALVPHRRARPTEVTVLHGDAAEPDKLLPRGRHVDAIVSSLPLHSLPAGVAAVIVAQWRALVRDGGIVVQFTYDSRGIEHKPLTGFLQRASAIVWANLPPARVLALEYRSSS